MYKPLPKLTRTLVKLAEPKEAIYIEGCLEKVYGETLKAHGKKEADRYLRDQNWSYATCAALNFLKRIGLLLL